MQFFVLTVSVCLLYISFSYSYILHNPTFLSKLKCPQYRKLLFNLHDNSKKRYAEILDVWRQDSVRKSESNTPIPPEDMELIETIVIAADQRKAKDIVVIDLNGISDSTNYMIILEGNNNPQNQAIVSAIEDDLKDKHGKTGKIQGEASSGWVCLDYGYIIINVLLPKMRAFYKIEKKWKDGKIVDISHLITNAPPSDHNTDDSSLNQFADETQDPFWSN